MPLIYSRDDISMSATFMEGPGPLFTLTIWQGLKATDRCQNVIAVKVMVLLACVTACEMP